MFKAGQGMGSRIGIFALILTFGLYSGHSWYNWHTIADLPALSFGGGIGLVLVSLFIGYSVSFKAEKSSDFLIDMDGELRKVIWPEVKPPFDPKAEAWGATYVVIVTVVVLTLFIYVVDQVLNFVLQDGLFAWLYQ
ncbi:MAG: preprotein translocase subunit SecE [Planctomycetota bacterium]